MAAAVRRDSRSERRERNSAFIRVVGRGREQGPQEHDAVRRAEQAVGSPLGVRHEPDHVAAFTADPGDVVEAAIGVVHVAQHDPFVVAQTTVGGFIAHVVPLEVVDRHPQHHPRCGHGSERGAVRFDPALDPFAQELQACVLLERAG